VELSRRVVLSVEGEWRVMWNSGFETTADVHTVPANAAHRSYGAVEQAATPSASVVDEIVTADCDDDHVDVEFNDAVAAADDRLQIGDASIQHSSKEVVVAVDVTTAPDHTAVW